MGILPMYQTQEALRADAKYIMRYRDLIETRPWKTFRWQVRPCLIASPRAVGDADCVVLQAEGHYGPVFTGRTEVFHGYFVRIVASHGEDWLGEDRRSLREALKNAAEAAEQSGWTVLAIGLFPEWRESGLSANTGFGSHPAYPDRAVHMLEPEPRNREK
jgi:hypothetical protein